MNELESERSALITQHRTETGGCGGCRRWRGRFCILDEKDVDLDEDNYSRGNSVLLRVWTKRCWLSVLAERVLIVIRLVTMAVVTELGNGMWFIHWFTDTSSSSSDVQCGQTSLRLGSNLVNNQVTLNLTAMQGNVIKMINNLVLYIQVNI